MRTTFLTAVAAFLADQLTKFYVVVWLDLMTLRAIDVLPPYLNFRMAWNRGVNFGLFANDAAVMRWVLIAVALAVSGWVLRWMARDKPGRNLQIAAGLLIGGALGNVVDRVLYGAVADFLNMSLPGWQNPYSFNVADISIFAGALGLVLMPQPKTTETPAPAKPRTQRTAPKPPARPAPKVPSPPPAGPRQPDLFAPADQQGRDGDGKPG